MFHKILVALDNSQVGQHVFNEAVALAKSTGASLMLLHALSPFDDTYPNPNPLIWQADSMYPTFHTEAVNTYMGQWEALKRETIEYLSKWCNDAKAAGVEADFTQEFGDAGKTICDVARNWQADLIMVGRRGRGGLSEFLLGSVSNYVLHHAPCSVLTVQGQVKQVAQEFQEVGTAKSAKDAK